MTQHTLFEQAIHATRQGDRKTAYRLMRQVLLANPHEVAAWVWMSRLVDDVGQQRECLERALALDPHCQEARDGLENIRIREVLLSARSIVVAQRPQEPRKLGKYLIELGYISEAQLNNALAEQRATQTATRRVALGDILIRQGLLTPQQLATALVRQQRETFESDPDRVPDRLGDYLVRNGLISLEQLEAVLAVQSELRKMGRQALLGELLIRFNYLTADVVDEMVAQQRRQFFSRFVG